METSRESLSYYQNTPQDKLMSDYLRIVNESIERIGKKIARLDDEKRVLEDSLDKLSKMELSEDGLLERLISTMTVKINSVNENLDLSKSRIEELEEQKDISLVQYHIDSSISYCQEEIELYEELAIRDEQVTGLSKRLYQEITEQLNNS